MNIIKKDKTDYKNISIQLAFSDHFFFSSKGRESLRRAISIPVRYNKGTTLLEVLIALVLFTFIAASLMRMTNTTINYQKKITRNIQDVKWSRNIYQVIRTDIRNAFYATDVNATIYISFIKQNQTDSNAEADINKLAKKNNLSQRQKIQLQTELTEFEEQLISPYLSRTVLFVGGFEGTQNQLDISSFSTAHAREEGRSSDQSIITYYLKTCKNRETHKIQSNCLWRKSTPITTQNTNPEEGDNEVVLLENVQTFELLYYSISTNEWLNTWKTGPNERNILPAAIQIKVEFKNRKKQSIKSELKIPLHYSFILPVQGGY
ncbi:MAG: hypothetical protein OXM55_00790 [Bdellovibrionales bacterium]|nr:hypothetical protein [Bdellovibrionales bacterium]